jgi:hypothetical protein
VAGKKEVVLNFKVCEQFSEWLDLAAKQIDRPKSQILRTCLLLSLPSVMVNPSLVDHTRLEDSRFAIVCQ